MTEALKKPAARIIAAGLTVAVLALMAGVLWAAFTWPLSLPVGLGVGFAYWLYTSILEEVRKA